MKKENYVLIGAIAILVIGGIGVGNMMASEQEWRITPCDLMDLENLGGGRVDCGEQSFYWDENDIQATGIFGHIIDYEASMETIEFEKEKLEFEQWKFDQTILLEQEKIVAINRLAEAVENMPNHSDVTIVW